MDNIEKFSMLFEGFDLKIISKGNPVEKERPTQTVSRLESNEQKTKADLKKTLTRLQKEYKQAQRSFKHNKISRQELFDFEWRLFEIQEELKRIEDQERGNTF